MWKVQKDQNVFFRKSHASTRSCINEVSAYMVGERRRKKDVFYCFCRMIKGENLRVRINQFVNISVSFVALILFISWCNYVKEAHLWI